MKKNTKNFASFCNSCEDAKKRKTIKIYISNEGLCGRSIPISRADFEKARANAKKSNTKPNKTDNASNTKPTNPPPNNK